ncbi:MAG: homoserine kinase [Rhodospirillaceae bacterium]|nr:MAG: homoserine kinase [Rhodospirillaceae bacterium]
MAVYTEISDEDLGAFVTEYDLGKLIAFKGIAEGVENSNYLLQMESAAYILTLYEKRVAREDLPFFLELMEHLAASGVACPTPIHGRDGQALHNLCGKPAAIVVFLQGMWPRRILPKHCHLLGRAMAELHLAGEDFSMSRENDFGPRGWETLFKTCEKNADSVRPGLAAEIREELDKLHEAWPVDLPKGIIHADLFPDNVFFLEDDLSGLIDFYFACNDFFAYDLAICLNAWCFETDGSFNITKAGQMIAAYRTIRPLKASEIQALPVLARGAAMRFLLTRLYDWLNPPQGALVKPKDPLEFLRRLRFHKNITDASAYGIT